MNSGRSGNRGGAEPGKVGSTLGTVALVVAAIVALWFCVRATILQLVEREYPLMGQAISPSSPVSLATIALNRVSARNGIADAQARELSASALRRAPLLAEPFVVAGLDASGRGDFARAERLMEEAKRRDPRSIIPRYWLFDSYLRRGDYTRGIAEAAPLIRAQPVAEQAAVAVLTALIPVPEARPALVESLRARPLWRSAFFRQAAASPRLRGEVVGLMSMISADGHAPTRRERQAIIRGMIDTGDYQKAYALWLQSLPPGQRPATPGLYDGGFRKLSGGWPFGWWFPEVPGAVGITPAPDAPSGSGLSVQIGTERTALLAEQLVLTNPGPFRLDFLVRGLDAAAGDAGVKLELRCGTGRGTLASTVVDDFTSVLRSHHLTAQVPAKCRTVLVRILSAPGIEAGSLNILLTGMSSTQRAAGTVPAS